MADAYVGGNVFAAVDFFAQIGETSLGFIYFYISVLDTGDTCRVIAAVFKLCKSVKQNGGNLLLSDISDYSAHNFNLFS